jgi:uncharacterized membrane protein YoaK (UPF0700 family)
MNAQGLAGSAAIAYGATLSLIAGYVDTLGFVALFGLFTSHITGNFVVIGSELVTPSQGMLPKLLVFPAFVAAVAFAKLTVESSYGRRSASPLRLLLMLQALFLFIFMFAGAAGAPIRTADAPAALVAGLAGSFAMGMQSAMHRLLLPTFAQTTAMTGNVTQVVIDMIELRHTGAPEARTRLSRMGPAVLAFGAGAIGGALCYRVLSFWALAIPAAVLLALSSRKEGRA